MGIVYPLSMAGVEMDTYQHGCPVYYLSHQNQEMEETDCSLSSNKALAKSVIELEAGTTEENKSRLHC